ncbi:MAG: metallophosphoesterase, partial [Candidatus Thiodiazotropha taylori]
VRGATLMRADGSVVFRDTIDVQLDGETVVKKQLSTEEHDSGEISVGQRVLVFGSLDSAESSLAADHLRMLVTVLSSTRVDDESALVVDLQKIDGRPVSLFDFSGTGSSAATDADPENYEVDHGALDISQINAGVPLRVIGFVTPFATAPADFTAQSLVDLTEVAAVLTLGYGSGSANAFSAISAEGLTLDLTDAELFHHLGRAGIVIDLTELAVEPVIVPHDDAEGSFWIEEGETLQLHTDFANFAEDLASRVESGSLVKGLLASGDYVDQSGVLTSRMVVVKLL